MIDDITLVEIIKSTLEQEFEVVQIVDVRLFEETDFDGDEILRIEVVFDGERKNVSAGAVSGAVRHVRPKLRKAGRTGFPLFSFISKSDAGVRLEAL